MKVLIVLICIVFTCHLLLNAQETSNKSTTDLLAKSSNVKLSVQDNQTKLSILQDRNLTLERHNNQLMTVLWSAIALIAAFLGAGFFFYRSQIQNERVELKLLLKTEIDNIKVNLTREIQKNIEELFQKTESSLEEKEKEFEKAFQKQLDTQYQKTDDLKKEISKTLWQNKKELQQSLASIYHYELKEYKKALKSYIWVLKYSIHLNEHQSDQYVAKEIMTMTLQNAESILRESIDIKDIDASDIRELDGILNQLPETFGFIKKKIQDILYN